MALLQPQTPSWWKAMPATLPESVSPQDYMAAFMANQAIRQMADPWTQAATAEYLARDLPALFPGYAGVPQPGVQQGALSPEQARAAAAALGSMAFSPFDVGAGIGVPPALKEVLGKKESAGEVRDIAAGLNWLRDYMKTAASGGAPGATRAQKLLATKHLETLGQEAQGGSGKRYLTLAENLVNPVVRRAGLSDPFTKRALNLPSGTYRRGGVAYRNPWAV